MAILAGFDPAAEDTVLRRHRRADHADRPPLDANARRVVAARFVSRTGGEAGFFVGIWGKAAYDLGASPGQLALLTATLGAAHLVGAAAAGVLVDRTAPKRVIVLGELLFVPSILLLVLADSMQSMTVLAPIAWATGAVVLTAVASMPPFLTPDERRLEAVNVALEVAGTLAFVAGPALGALLVRVAPIDSVFFLDAATSVAAVALVARVRLQPATVAPTERRRGLTELRDGFAQAYGRRPIRLLLVVGSLTWLSFGAFTALEPLFFRDVLGTGPSALGWVNAVFGVGLLGGALVLRQLPGRLTSLAAVTWLTMAGGLGAVVYTGTADLRIVLIGAVLWGAVLGMLMPLLRTLAQLHTRPGFFGRVMGVFNVHHQVGEMLPLAIAPTLAVVVGVQPVLAGTGVVLLLAAPLALPAARRIDAERPVPGVAPDDLTTFEALEEHVAPGT